mmetsp:Transcript_128689/g.411468  ORF Transcript_128689/g.411468 Transcript_128689/m.411468 type:complete len:136 (+) Transcript_128689:58-465(+)
MVAFRPVAALAAGAIAAQLPLFGLVLQGQVPALQAALGWSTTPKCVFKNGVCMEGATVEAGKTCMPKCSDATKSPSDNTSLACPVSNGKSSPDNGWWLICGQGTGACAKNNELGAIVTCPAAAKSTSGLPPTTRS